MPAIDQVSTNYPFEYAMTAAICLNLQLMMSNKLAGKHDRKQMHQTGWVKYLCLAKHTRYIEDTVITETHNCSMTFLEGQFFVLLLLASLSSASSLLLRDSATRLRCPSKNRQEMTRNFLYFKASKLEDTRRHQVQSPSYVPACSRTQKQRIHKTHVREWTISLSFYYQLLAIISCHYFSYFIQLD